MQSGQNLNTKLFSCNAAIMNYSQLISMYKSLTCVVGWAFNNSGVGSPASDNNNSMKATFEIFTCIIKQY